MVGRDLGLGRSLPSTMRFGVRVAEIRGKTTGAAQWNRVPSTASIAVFTCPAAATPALYCVTHKRDYTQDSNFFGGGPRIEFDGSVPLAPQWSIDYMAGFAALYGRRTVVQTVNVRQSVATATTPTPTFPVPVPLHPSCISGCPVNAAFSDNAWVPNLDAMIGLSYAITPNLKATLSYRFDGYWNALKGLD